MVTLLKKPQAPQEGPMVSAFVAPEVRVPKAVRVQRGAGRYGWAMLRLSMGWVFLWAFLDKTFGLGYATTSENAWVNGGSPTHGYLTFATKGPFADFFQSIAGNAFVDWMFMAGLLAVGVALLLGIGVLMASVAGAAMLMLMYVAANMLPTNNPFMDEHIVYGVIMIILPLVYAGRTLGLGRWWAATALVQRFRILE